MASVTRKYNQSKIQSVFPHVQTLNTPLLLKLTQQYQMNNQDSSESQNQGFIPNRISIVCSDTKEDFLGIQQYSSFEAKYIFGSPMLKKEPLETYSTFLDIPVRNNNSLLNNESKSNNYLKATKTVHEQYMNANLYELSYSRFREPFGKGLKSSFQHEIKLRSPLLNNDKFRRLRQAQTLVDISKLALGSLYENQDLIFDSKMEGGNLLCAFKSLAEKDTYILFMQNDTNTYGYNQWFYFSIKNAKKLINYTFKIVNFKKKYSFFTKGMQPLVFSYLKHEETGNGWYRDGNNITYSKSAFEETQCEAYHTLQFQLTFLHQNDYNIITMNPPYSYTRLMKFIEEEKVIAEQKQISFELRSICQSLGGNNVPYIIISRKEQLLNKKQIIVMMARQHSGQTWSSFLMQEIIRYIVQQENVSVSWLLQHYEIHIFPMVNVDGVIYGNFRCDLSGYDLNRCWKSPSISIHPQNYFIKEQIERLSERNIELFLDLHTHSKAFGSFAYSCVQSPEGRRFPEAISQMTSLFRYGACTFNIEKQKELTARAITYAFTKNVNTITIELSSFGFKNRSAKKYSYFTGEEMKILSKSILNAFFVYKTVADIDLVSQNGRKASSDKHIQDDFSQISDSDSEPEIDQIQMSKKLQRIFPIKFRRQFFFRNKLKQKKMKKMKQKIKANNSQFKNKSVQMQEQQKEHEQVNRNRVKTEYEAKDININYDAINSYSKSIALNKESIKKKSIMFPRKPEKLNEPSLNKTRLRMMTQVESKPLNYVEFSLKKLPIFDNNMNNKGFKMILENKISFNLKKKSQDKKQLTGSKRVTYIYNKNTTTHKFTKGHLYQKLNQSLYQPKDEFPYLVVMSESMKKQQLKKKMQCDISDKMRSLKKSYNITSMKQSGQQLSLLGHNKEKKKDKIQHLQRSWMKNVIKYSPYCQNIE